MSTKNNEIARITIDMPKVDHKRLKIIASALGVSIKKLVLESIDEKLSKFDFNEGTKKAIANAQKGKGLTQYKDSEDLFKKLGI